MNGFRARSLRLKHEHQHQRDDQRVKRDGFHEGEADPHGQLDDRLRRGVARERGDRGGEDVTNTRANAAKADDRDTRTDHFCSINFHF